MPLENWVACAVEQLEPKISKGMRGWATSEHISICKINLTGSPKHAAQEVCLFASHVPCCHFCQPCRDGLQRCRISTSRWSLQNNSASRHLRLRVSTMDAECNVCRSFPALAFVLRLHVRLSGFAQSSACCMPILKRPTRVGFG